MPDKITDYEARDVKRLTSDNRGENIQALVKAEAAEAQALEDGLYLVFDTLALP